MKSSLISTCFNLGVKSLSLFSPAPLKLRLRAEENRALGAWHCLNARQPWQAPALRCWFWEFLWPPETLFALNTTSQGSYFNLPRAGKKHFSPPGVICKEISQYILFRLVQPIHHPDQRSPSALCRSSVTRECPFQQSQTSYGQDNLHHSEHLITGRVQVKSSWQPVSKGPQHVVGGRI